MYFSLNFFLCLGSVTGNAENDGASLLYFLEDVTKAAGLDGATRRVGAGIEKKHHWFAGVVLQVYGFVFFGLKREVGNFVVHLHEKGPSQNESAMQRDYSMMTSGTRMALMVVALAVPAGAQYPGHMETNKKTAPTIRAVAVVEWTGDKGKPSASRLIPISVFDGEQYQPGGLYMAKPEPLALEPGTEYVLEDAGVARGLFDVNTAQDVDGYWFGYGALKPMTPGVKKAKPKQGRNMPQVVKDSGDSRPHFKGRDAKGDAPDSSSTSGNAPAPASAGDPDRPYPAPACGLILLHFCTQRRHAGEGSARDGGRRSRPGSSAYGPRPGRHPRMSINHPSSMEFLPACSR